MDRIRQWFDEHDDGEFATPPRNEPYAVVPPAASSQCVLYTTKPRSVLALLPEYSADCPCGMIGRYGLPCEEDVQWLQTAATGQPLLFLGDADPCDLLVFAWLRSRVEISFRGVNDRLLEACGVTLNDRITLAQANDETAATPLLGEVVPDWQHVLGPKCAAALSSGRKVEVEGWVSFATVERRAMVKAIV